MAIKWYSLLVAEARACIDASIEDCYSTVSGVDGKSGRAFSLLRS